MDQMLLMTAVMVMGALALLSAIPQILKVHKTRHTHSFSLYSWSMWWLNQAVFTAYAISIKAWLITALAVGWLVFYSVMLWMIIEYRKPGKGKK